MEAVRGRYLGRKKGHRHFGEKDGAGAWHVLLCPWAASVSKTNKKSHPTNGNEIPFSVYCT